nr:carboxypeptidase-like regulatory domain-containing protein [uncultured Roseateles sp.]
MVKAVIQASILSGSVLSVLPGAAVEVRNADTGALVQLWSDRNGLSVLGNPVYSNSEGFFRAYANPGRYRITASLPSGLTREWDDVVVSAGSEPSEINALNYEGVDPTGATYSDTGFTAFLADCAGKAGRVPPGYYKFQTANFAFPTAAGTTITHDGVTFDISEAPAAAFMYMVDGSEGTRYSLTANVAKGAFTCSMSTADLAASGIVAGKWVRLASDARIDPGRTNSRMGEQLRVKSINSGTGVVTFESPACAHYLTADLATISLMNHVQRPSLKGPSWYIKGANNSSNQRGVRFSICERAYVEGLHAEGTDNAALWLRDCVSPTAVGIWAENLQNASSAYALSCDSATQDLLVIGLQGRDVRHLFTTSNSTATPGNPRRVTVNGFTASRSAPASGGSGGDALDTHAAAEDIHFANGTIYGATSQGVNFEARSGSLSSVFIYDPVDNGVGVHNECALPGEINLSNVHVWRSGNNGIVVNNGGASLARTFAADATTDTITLSGNTGYWPLGAFVELTTTGTLPAGLSLSTRYYVRHVGAHAYTLHTTAAAAIANTGAIDITDTGVGTHTATIGAAPYRSVVASNLSAIDSAQTAILIAASSSKPFSSIQLSRLTCDGFGSAVAGVYLQHALSGSVTGISANGGSSTTAFNIRLRDLKNFVATVLNGSVVSGSTGGFLYINSSASGASDNVTVDDIAADSPSAVGSRGVLVDNNATNVSIGENKRLNGFTTEISWGSGTGHRGGYLRGSTTYDPPDLAAGAKQQTTVTVTGARIGDFVRVTFSLANAGIRWSGEVTSNDTVTVTQENVSGSAVNLSSGTLKATVTKH